MCTLAVDSGQTCFPRGKKFLEMFLLARPTGRSLLKEHQCVTNVAFVTSGLHKVGCALYRETTETLSSELVFWPCFQFGLNSFGLT